MRQALPGLRLFCHERSRDRKASSAPVALRQLFPRSAVKARARPRDFLCMERESSHAAEKHSATNAMAEREVSKRSHAVAGNRRERHCWLTRLSRHVLGSVSSGEDLAGSTQPRKENWHRAGTSASVSLSVNVKTIMVTDLFRLFASGIAEQNVVDQPRAPDHRRDRD
jgi:hypothetical protein